MPELLSLLKDIRLETLSEKEFTKNLSLFSLEELKALLVRREKSLTFLSGYNEEQIYQIVEQVIPAESPFVIDYARALDKEKELGMLEGKAGNDFRILKWVFIFEVILGRGKRIFPPSVRLLRVKGIGGALQSDGNGVIGIFLPYLGKWAANGLSSRSGIDHCFVLECSR